LVNGTAGRQGSLRRLGQAGCAEPMVTAGTTGRIRREGIFGEEATYTFAVVPAGSVSSKDQTGWAPFGAETVTRTREPAR
jgi:hypothetical protein